MSVIVDLTVFPVGVGESLSPYVARVLRVIRDSGLPYELGPMSTSIEGEWGEVMAVVTACFEELRSDCGRISMTMRVDWREGEGRMRSKPESVLSKLPAV
ncbi:uncharacterized protein (TIGR00106 family) [Desulfobaculum xiamenense]|uniref:Uncharacterized protein (TIGR00106 family) n=1 Tax=Desulfobaculum xiamenense TaxID=995050 RepID=A0A846QKS9_9BACT|nr:MTH1187 family thiamine-binding protein [Desulfobaculum xiamenense]NJB67660.1 uncharacterized protein (TIGR00106 family) [Desulfobaculum xiamenense]